MSSLAHILARGPVDCAPASPYLLRADVHEHDFEHWLRGAVGVVARRINPRRRLLKLVRQIGALEAEVQALDDTALRGRFHAIGREIAHHGFDDACIVRSYACVREAARRSLGKRPYDVQVLGGLILLRGMVAEMATGEGKTLVATLPACTAASMGAHVHVVTVNDYLAERDAEIMTPLYAFLGLEVGIIKNEMSPEERRAAYACPVCYVSNKELVFDYLKDVIAQDYSLPGASSSLHKQLARLTGGRAQGATGLRGLHVAIVDEADSVFIDEARTPLIISATRDAGDDLPDYQRALAFAQALEQGRDFLIGADQHIDLTEGGRSRAERELAPTGGLWQARVWREQRISQALSALHLFRRDQHYILADNKVQIVDESTGRVMADRSWEHGLHQMIEVKEGCELTGSRETLARITYQRFFSKYLLLCGMTGTAQEVQQELWTIYGLRVVRVPTHRPLRRRHLGAWAGIDPAARWEAVADRVATLVAEKRRAVLVGTRSVEASEALAAVLSARAIPHVVLNARQDAEEAEIVAQAGGPGRVTIATNMAGRGTDIHLDETVRAAGGLYVILTEYHESSRVDRQLFGRSGRQGDPGNTEALVSLDDELFTRYAVRPMRVLRPRWRRLPAWAQTLALRFLVRHAQHAAGREARRTRFATWRHDRQNRDQLAFSGQGKEGW